MHFPFVVLVHVIDTLPWQLNHYSGHICTVSSMHFALCEKVKCVCHSKSNQNLFEIELYVIENILCIFSKLVRPYHYVAIKDVLRV
jgi:hypothetical protein